MTFRAASPFAALFFALAASGCAASPGPTSPAQLAIQDQTTTDALLQSSAWQLVSWRPDQPLEAMFSQLLNQQFATMSIHFQNGRLHADSPSVHIDRAYQIRDAAGPQFTLIVTDENGVPIQTTAHIATDGQSIDFRGQSDPWLGTGTIRKVQ
jgi:hypothetical protein